MAFCQKSNISCSLGCMPLLPKWANIDACLHKVAPLSFPTQKSHFPLFSQDVTIKLSKKWMVQEELCFSKMLFFGTKQDYWWRVIPEKQSIWYHIHLPWQVQWKAQKFISWNGVSDGIDETFMTRFDAKFSFVYIALWIRCHSYFYRLQIS